MSEIAGEELAIYNSDNKSTEDYFTHERVKILVVDDLPEKLMVYQSILEEMDQEIFSVSSGSDALKLLLKHEFAVILLDVNMPGMDGFEIANMISKRKKSAHTPIIFLTAFTDEMYAAQGYASGAVDYLPTPVVPAVLRAKVRVFIELFQMRRQAAYQAKERAMREAAEESANRSEFIGRASKVLASAHNQADLSTSLLKLSVPYLSKISILWSTSNDTIPEAIDYLTEGSKNGSDSLPLPRQNIKWLDDAINDVLATKQFKIISDIAEFKFSEDIKNANYFEKINSALLLPLSIRGNILGVLVLTREKGEPDFQQNYISLARDLVSRASVALENVLLIEKVQEADRRKDEFLGMLAHELRNPLGPVSNAIQLLKMMPKDSDFSQVHGIIDRQVKHMSRLIDDLLDATRLANGKVFLRKESCNLGKIVSQTVEDYKSIFAAKNVKLNVNICPTNLLIDADPTRLIQAIGNLLHNAHKFTNAGGSVTISLIYDNNDSAIIKVSDTGIGIEPKILPYVFDVFRQAEQGLDRSQGGLGLGLALVKGLIELHGGKVNAANAKENKGTVFSLYLPVTLADAEPKIVNEVEQDSNAAKYKILVIEDNKDAAESAKLLLSLEGHEVKVANTGIDGVNLAKSFKPNVILCDVGLPGMDGYQVVKSLRADPDLSKTYIIALTGYGRAEDQKKSYEAGFCMHLIKPIDYSNLRNVLANLETNIKPQITAA